MLDIKLIRDNPDIVKDGLKKRNMDTEILNTLLKYDERRRDLLKETENLRAIRNENSKRIPILKKEKKHEAAEKIIHEGKEVSSKIKEIDRQLKLVAEEYEEILLHIPNIPDLDVPFGNNEKDNEIIKEWGNKKIFEFEPKAHWDLAEINCLMDFERGAKLSGSRFTILKGNLARLERALINFMLETHTINNNYIEILPPHLVIRDTLVSTGHLPKFEEELYNTQPDDLFLIPTSEVTLIGMHKDEILRKEDLPIKYAGYTPNYRREAGSYGKDIRGYIRQHQFNKVELVWLTNPEESDRCLDKLVNDAEKILQLLELPYRVSKLCSGDLGFSSKKTYDLEVWLPANKEYKEISSCSNTGDFQCRRGNIKFRDSENKVRHLNALNGSGLAVGRTLVAIMENYQTKEGKIKVPEVLKKYMGVDEI